MKLVKCIIQPDKLDEVKAALSGILVKGMTISEVMGFDYQAINAFRVQPEIQTIESQKKFAIEVVAPDNRVRQVLDTMIAAARSGRGDDGKIFIMNIDQAVRIRTGESDDAAL